MKASLNININDFNYSLPDEKIAKYPLEQRDSSKLLIFNNSEISENIFRSISDYIPANSLMLFNDTKVINARLIFYKETGSRIEVFCLEPQNPLDYAQSLSSNKKCSWKCLIGNNKKWKYGSLFKEIKIKGLQIILKASRIKGYNESFEVLFEWDNENVVFSEILEAVGNIPVPPYLNRDSEDIDKERYQTVYSKYNGSVAAPTAGLHFTNSVFNNLRKKNIIIDSVTLHVGAGTFKPLKTGTVSQHEMHTESFQVKKTVIENIINNLGNITVVGTTTVRTIESIYQLGLEIINNPYIISNNFFISQWQAYENIKERISTKDVLNVVVEWMNKNNYEYLNCSTQIMILPGYVFKLTDRLITNFHQPKSTLLLLLAAFIGDNWREVYDYALANNFRFLSYGDSSIFFR